MRLLLFYIYPACFSLVFNLPVCLCRHEKFLTGFFEFLRWPFCTRVRRFRTQSAALWLAFFELWARQFGPCNYLFQCNGSLSDLCKGYLMAPKQKSVSEIQFGKTPICLYSAHTLCLLYFFIAPAINACDNWLSNYTSMMLKWCINICWLREKCG